MSNLYSNIPPRSSASSSNPTVEVFNNYYKLPVSISNNDLVAMIGFFESKGFEPVSAERTAVIILTQAAKDGYSAMQVMDTLKGLDSIEISGLVAEILNYNRVNTSLLGVVQYYSPSEEVIRNIIA
jgi:hypothetical protein